MCASRTRCCVLCVIWQVYAEVLHLRALSIKFAPGYTLRFLCFTLFDGCLNDTRCCILERPFKTAIKLGVSLPSPRDAGLYLDRSHNSLRHVTLNNTPVYYLLLVLLQIRSTHEKTQRQARKDSKAGKYWLKGRQELTQRQARIESKACKKWLKDRQEMTQRQARFD
jgi:hypothetical protein